MGVFGKSKKEWQSEVDELQHKLTALQNEINIKEERLNHENDLLEQRKKEFECFIAKQNEAIKAEFLKLDSEKIDFENKRTEYEPKFQEAITGFSEKKIENEADIQRRISETNKYIQSAISENAKKLTEEQKLFAEKISETHQQSEREHEELLLAQTKKRIQETDAELESRRHDISKKEAEIRQREIELKNENDKLTQDRKDFEHQNAILDADKQIVIEKKASIDEQAQELADAKIKELNARLENYKTEYERLSRERADLETQLNAFSEIKERLNGEEPEVIITKIQSLIRDLTDARTKLASYPDNVEQELNKKEGEIESLKSQRDDLNYKLLEMQKLANTAELNEVNNASLEAQVNILKQDRHRLETLNAEQDETIKHYRELYDKQATLEEKLKSVMMPHENFTKDKIRKEPIVFAKKEENNPKTDESASGDAEIQTETTSVVSDETVNDEIIWLRNLTEKIEEYGLSFSPRIIKAFHTALKTAEWSPLTVLAGVSGTGKSELPQLYAKFGGINFLNVPVQPNWDSQEALLGYYNTISSKFEAQPLLKYLVQTQQPESEDYAASLKKQMNIVLLDEMNLAHIEQYFAEFLSKLEERRGKDEGTPQYPALSVKLGGTDSYPLPLGRNVLWVGTMNQDETTKSLSDKVLDRGIVINFPRPNEFKRRTEINKDIKTEERYLPVETWNSWKVNFTKKQVEDSEKVIVPYKELVEEINKEISNIGRAIGHRVWQSIENYIWNYPDVRRLLISEKADMNDSDFNAELRKKIDVAFEDQLVQKIMPKLCGIETRGESKNVLEKIRGKIDSFKAEGHTINILKDFENARKFGDGQFLWVTSEYLNTETENQ